MGPSVPTIVSTYQLMISRDPLVNGFTMSPQSMSVSKNALACGRNSRNAPASQIIAGSGCARIRSRSVDVSPVSLICRTPLSDR